MRRLLVFIGLLGLCLIGVVTSGPRSAVDWRTMRAVAIESDDWGLAGFVPAAGSWQDLDREALAPGRFPPVYWESTLEDSLTVANLAAVLSAHRGRDGVAAVFQPNYVMGSLAWEETTNSWRRYELPNWPPEYRRPGMWTAVENARSQGVWHPELHAAFHYDPNRRRENGLENELAREVTRRGVTLFPGSEEARELAPWRSRQEMSDELDLSLAVFERVFRRPADAIIAPDYTWHGWVEQLWESRGLRVIQAKREQQNPLWLKGKPGRIQKYLDRQWSRLAHPDRVYLERNCRLEPVQAEDPAAVIAACLDQTRQAWQRGEPAIVEAHRVNFAHTDPQVVAMGLAALRDYLDGVCAMDPAPVFLCDSEIAQLREHGVSWRVAGDQLILRNGSQATRVVFVPGAALADHGRGGEGDGVLGFRIPAQDMRSVAIADLP